MLKDNARNSNLKSNMEKLESYYRKRDFAKTGEPRGSKSGRNREPIFVVQKHDARNLHYDFRLEIGGVLKSWAVPKGPSLDPSVKRLAVLTENHPLEYAKFEGTIPEGEYGAGKVSLWDRGKYFNKRLRKQGVKKLDMEGSFRDGLIEIELKGHKLKGGWALKKLQKDNWLLIKMNDDKKD
jgi:DNA ligase D-like protein (predicted 3'-phosphoesterase)